MQNDLNYSAYATERMYQKQNYTQAAPASHNVAHSNDPLTVQQSVNSHIGGEQARFESSPNRVAENDSAVQNRYALAATYSRDVPSTFGEGNYSVMNGFSHLQPPVSEWGNSYYGLQGFTGARTSETSTSITHGQIQSFENSRDYTPRSFPIFTNYASVSSPVSIDFQESQIEEDDMSSNVETYSSGSDDDSVLSPDSLSPGGTTYNAIPNLLVHHALRLSEAIGSGTEGEGTSEADTSTPDRTFSTSPPSRSSYGLVGDTTAPFYCGEASEGDKLRFKLFQTFFTVYSDHLKVMPVIDASPVNGVKKYEQYWTSYRRNYLSVQSSYTLVNMVAGKPLYLVGESTNGSRTQIQGLALRLTATMDIDAGKETELVQFTAKRDAGSPVKFVRVNPKSRLNAGTAMGASEAPLLPMQNEVNNRISSATCPHEVTFERIQFKAATQNNGKRRSHQCFYYLVLGLYADIRAPGASEPSYVKIAHSVTDKLVVRGRSPGHYNGTAKKSSDSTSGGNGNSRFAHEHDPNGRSSGSRSGGRRRSGGSSWDTGYTSNSGSSYSYSNHMSQQYSTAPLGTITPYTNVLGNTSRNMIDNKPSVTMTKAEETHFDTFGGYAYYPGGLQQGSYDYKPVKMEPVSSPTDYLQLSAFNNYAARQENQKSSGHHHGAGPSSHYTYSNNTSSAGPTSQYTYSNNNTSSFNAGGTHPVDPQSAVPRYHGLPHQMDFYNRFLAADTSRGLYPSLSAGAY